MNTAVGQVLRFVGLIVEMWGVYNLFGNQDRVPAPAMTTMSPPSIALFAGFVLWISGTIVIFRERRRNSQAARDQP